MKAPTACPWLKQAGFTLVEVVIALTLLAITLSLLFNALHTAAKSWELGRHHAEQADQQRSVVNFLRRELELAQAITRTPKGGRAAVEFDGWQQGVRFVAPLPRVADGLQLITITAEPGSDHQRLSLSYQTYHPDVIDDNESAAHIALVDKLAEVEFAYYGRSGFDSEPEWRDNWHDPDNLPRLIRVRIKETADGNGDWPELVIAPYIANDKPAYKRRSRRRPPARL